MRLVTWNIRAGGGRQWEVIGERITGWEPDVVVLCEFRGTPPSRQLSEYLEAAGLAHQVTTASARRPAANALLLASRWPLLPVRVRGAPREPQRWLCARVGAPEPFTVGALHVPNRVSGRKYPFLDALLRMARGWRRGPALFTGDTNSGCKGIDEERPAFNGIEDSWMRNMERAGWCDAFRRLHGEAEAYSWYSPNGRNGFRLDETFANRRLAGRLAGARYDWGGNREAGTAPSDHAALIVDLEG